jgi:hypothetical protein
LLSTALFCHPHALRLENGSDGQKDKHITETEDHGCDLSNTVFLLFVFAVLKSLHLLLNYNHKYYQIKSHQNSEPGRLTWEDVSQTSRCKLDNGFDGSPQLARISDERVGKVADIIRHEGWPGNCRITAG